MATDGATALADAKLRAEQVGQQNEEMTFIAQQARALAEVYVFRIMPDLHLRMILLVAYPSG